VKIEELNVRWPDSSIRGISVDYDALKVEIQEGGKFNLDTRTLFCLGFLGFQMIGFWDEVIIRDAKIYSEHHFIAKCEHRVKQQLPSGSIERSVEGNSLFEMELIDGCKLWVCAKHFVADSPDSTDGLGTRRL